MVSIFYLNMQTHYVDFILNHSIICLNVILVQQAVQATQVETLYKKSVEKNLNYDGVKTNCSSFDIFLQLNLRLPCDIHLLFLSAAHKPPTAL